MSASRLAPQTSSGGFGRVEHGHAPLSDPETAKQMALYPPADGVLEVEMMIRRDSDGSWHVSDPYSGVRAPGQGGHPFVG